MADPLSPDEGVRAALKRAADDLEIARNRFSLMGGTGIYQGVDLGIAYESARDGARRARAALSTPVPEEGLPRGSASAAEQRWMRAELEAIAGEGQPFLLPCPHCGVNAFYEDRPSERDHLVECWSCPAAMTGDTKEAVVSAWNTRTLSAEAGDGAASALPSPLPSQGEPVAVAGYLFDQTVGNFLFERERTRFLPYEPGDTERFGIRNVRAVVLASEHEAALAAERARADRAEEDVLDRLYEEVLKEVESGYGALGGRAAANWLESRNAMRKADRAALRARNILKETPDDA